MNKTALIKRLIAKCRSLDNTAIDLACKVAELERRLDEARTEAANAYDSASEAEARAARSAQRSREAERAAEEARNDADHRDWKKRDILDRLNRARDWGDTYGEERALRELRDL